MQDKVLNFIAFQAGWFACVLGAANGVPMAGPAVVLAAVLLHLARVTQPWRELILLSACAGIGLVFDSALVLSGWVSYPNGYLLPGLAPYWIVSMWVLFGTTLNVSMGWLLGRPWLAAVFGAVGGPLSYLAGARLGAMSFQNPAAALAVLALGWAVVLPLLAALASRTGERNIRPPSAGAVPAWRGEGASRHA